MKRRVLGITGIAAMFVFSGCAMDKIANDYSPENIGTTLTKKMDGGNPTKFLQTVEDKEMGQAFAEYYNKDSYVLKYTNDNIMITKKLVYFSENVYMSEVNSYIERSNGEEEFFQKYKDLVKKRGNNYKVLTGMFNKQLWMAKLSRDLPNVNNRTQLMKWSEKPAIAEFNKNGELVSVMLNTYLIAAGFNKLNSPYVQSDIDLQIVILTGASLNRIKNNISMSDWEMNTIQAK